MIESGRIPAGSRAFPQVRKEQGNAGKKQQQSAHPMQDRNHCGEWLPDFQKVEVLGAFFLQLFIPLLRTS